MPHVVLEGPLRCEDIWLAFQPLEFHEGGRHFKASECYLSSDRKTLLVKSLVVEREFPRAFYMRILESGENQLTLGLEPQGGPERTDAVKRYLGLCAWQILQSEPETVITKGNIREFVKGPESDA